MDPITAAAAIGAGGAVIGGLMDKQSSNKESKERKKAREAYERALAERQARILGIDTPDLQEATLPGYSDVYNFTPEEMEALRLQDSALANYSSDPRFQQSQMDSLRKLAELSEGKLTDSDRLALQEAQIEESRADAGRQQAIMQDMARRGQGGGGAELAARLQSAQGAADRASASQGNALQAANARALQALAAQGSLAGSMRSQQLQEAEAVANARDRIAQANWENSQRVANNNVAARNQAGQAKANNIQRVADNNVGVASQQAMMGNDIRQQNYDNLLRREGLIGSPSSDPYNMSRQDASANAQNDRRVFGQFMDAGILGGTAAYNAYGDDEPASKAKKKSPTPY